MKLPDLKNVKMPDKKSTGKQSEKKLKHTNEKKSEKKKVYKAPIPIRFLRTVGSVILTTFLSFTLFFAVTGIICGIAATSYVINYMDTTQAVSIQELAMSSSTNIYATNPEGEQEIIYTVHNDIQRIPVEIDQVPQHVRNAFVYAEDKNFYTHEGVDYKRTAASFANMLFDFWGNDQGGSTISQQLIKNLTGDNEKSPQRKIREIFRAMQLEKSYSKDEILINYINIIGFGGPISGVQRAAQEYFGKDVWDISIAEAACLAAIPQSPEVNNPFAGRYIRKHNKVTDTDYYSDEKENTGRAINRDRMEYILGQMYENGAITYDEYQEALAEKLIFTDTDEYKSQHPELFRLEDGVYVEIKKEKEEYDKKTDWWVVNRALTELRDQLMEERGVDKSRALTLINTGGYQIYTTYDMEMQEYVEEKFSDLNNLLKGITNSKNTATVNRKGEPMNLQCGFTAIDYHGNILCTVGGVEMDPAPLGDSYACTIPQQVGSAIKPVTAYGYALDNGYITYASKLLDRPPVTINGKPWPTNYSDSNNITKFSGNNVTVEYALEQSLNTIPALLCKTYGLDNVFNFATETLGLELNQSKDRDYSPLAVGGLSYGITIEDLVNAFMVYGSGGYFSDAHIISRVESTDGRVIYSFGDDYEQVIKPETATIMNHLLQNVVQKGTGKNAKLYANGKQIPIAGKTGTTSDWYDKLFVGLNPDFVSGIWVGYPQNKTIQLYQKMDTPTIWKNIIGQWITTHYSGADYPPCENVVSGRYCTNTGKIAGANCPKSATIGYWSKDNAPYCNSCRVASTDKTKDKTNDKTESSQPDA